MGVPGAAAGDAQVLPCNLEAAGLELCSRNMWESGNKHGLLSEQGEIADGCARTYKGNPAWNDLRSQMPSWEGESRVVWTRMLWEKGHPQCSCCVSSWRLCLEAWFQWKTWIKLLRVNPESRSSILRQLTLRQFRTPH